MILTIDTSKAPSPVDLAILKTLLGIRENTTDVSDTTVAEAPAAPAFDLVPAAMAFVKGYNRHIETASTSACLRVAVEECRGLLPGPLSTPDAEIVRVAARIFLDDTTNRTLHEAALMIVKELAQNCSPKVPPAVPDPGSSAPVPPVTSISSKSAPAPGV